MANFPNGSFTITNNDTGRCLRARLGTTHDVSDHKEGTKYLQYITDEPWLELGEPDGSIATAWHLDTGAERFGGPRNQITSTAVRDLQNIGDFCVWFHTGRTFTDGEEDTADDYEDRARAQHKAKRNRSRARRRYLEEYIDSLVPKKWAAAQKTLDRWEHWCGVYDYRRSSDNEDAFWDDCAKHGPGTITGDDRTAVVKAIQAYAREAAKDGVHIASEWGPAAMGSRLWGNGGTRGGGSNYGWATDGTHIYAADDKTVSPDTSYWTDLDGQLVGRPKGEPGQNWTIAAWTPPAKPTGPSREQILLTGLFGGVGRALGIS
ncbi:hypothetical protein ACFYTQ_03415 [Nocardia sp. NPDC004068]|uniref:hypothetical protein n=1 Tax=Nocardia sp. NPDC004068 TaxID=3364303 RepID=UPI00368F0FC0